MRTAQRRYPEAFELHEKAHQQYLSTLGRNHYRVAGILAKMGIHNHRKGELVKAKYVYVWAGRFLEVAA